MKRNLKFATIALLFTFLFPLHAEAVDPPGNCTAQQTCEGSAQECCEVIEIENKCTAGFQPKLTIVDDGMGASHCDCVCTQAPGTATCEIEIDPDEAEVIVNITDLSVYSELRLYKITVYSNTCKSFNPGQNYLKAFCAQVRPQAPNSNFTEAHIETSWFHSGHYTVYIHPRKNTTQCPEETDNPLALCEFNITTADGAQQCTDTGECIAEKVCETQTAECCKLTENDEHKCREGYMPAAYFTPGGMGVPWGCGCLCTLTGTLTPYDPCKDLLNDSPDSEQSRCYQCFQKDGVWTALGCISSKPADFIKTLIRIGFGIGGGIAFLFMVMGVIKILTSQGNPETLNDGRGMITSAVAGLLLIIFSVIVLKIIGVDILELPGFKK